MACGALRCRTVDILHILPIAAVEMKRGGFLSATAMHEKGLGKDNKRVAFSLSRKVLRCLQCMRSSA